MTNTDSIENDLALEASGLPNGWHWKPLGLVADNLDNKRKPINAAERETRKGDVPYYGATGQVGWIDKHLLDEEVVLVGEDGAPFLEPGRAKAYMISGKSWVNNHAHILRARDGMPNAYLMHYLNILDYSPYVTGTTRLKLTKGAMNKIPVPVAPLPQQRHIVEAIELQLGRLDAAVARLQGAKARLKRYKQAVLKAAVEGRLTHPALPEGELPDGWRVERLADIVADGPSNGYSPKPSKDQKGTKSLKLSATTTGRMILNEDTIKYIPEVVPKESKYWLRPGDVLLQRANSLEYLGVAAMYTGGHHEYIYPDLMMRVRLDNPHLAQYLVQYLNTTTARQYFIKRATGTAGNMPKINGETVRELEVPVPTERDLPILLAKLDEALTGADEMEATLDAQLQQAVRLRQAVLKRAFEGRLG